MNSKYKNPYKTKYKLEIIDKINRDGTTYGKLENPPYFLGSERLSPDQILISGEEPQFLSGNKSYFKIDKGTKNVEIEIGWKNRLLLMQENLGNALVRHFLKANTNIDIIGYKVENSSSYIDVSAKDFKFMTAKNIESLANYAVFSNLTIENFDDHISIERLADIPYEGPALTRTGEIGMIFISSVEKVNSMIRLTITSGENAYKLARNSLNILDNMKMYLNSDSINSVFSDVKKLKSNLTSSKISHRNLGEEKIENFEKDLKKDKLNNPIKDAETSSEKNVKNENNFIKEETVPKVENSKDDRHDKNIDKALEEKELKIENQKEIYDANFFHEKYKLESFKDLNRPLNPIKEETPIETNKEENTLKEKKSNDKIENKEKYDASFFHEKYKLESFKDLNKKMTTDEDKTSKEKSLDNMESKMMNPKENFSTSSSLNKKEDEERTSLFYQAVESFKNFSTEFSGLNYIYKVLQDVNLKELREISNYILKEDDFIQIYGLKNGAKSKILILRSQNLNFDLKKIFEKLRDQFTYTGTGNMYTLDIQCKEEDLTRIMESFLIEIRREAK